MDYLPVILLEGIKVFMKIGISFEMSRLLLAEEAYMVSSANVFKVDWEGGDSIE